MKEYNLLGSYPKPTKPRFVGKNLRTIKHRIIASKRDFNFFDGNRNYGYGGFKYDGRWAPIAKKIINLIIKLNFFTYQRSNNININGTL